MIETWKDVEGRPYQASDLGRVRRIGCRMGRECLSQYINSHGYPCVTISVNKVKSIVCAHTLVAAAFIGPKKPGMEVNHKDGNKSNNTPGNLEYMTCKENVAHAFRTGLRAIRRGIEVPALTDERKENK